MNYGDLIEKHSKLLSSELSETLMISKYIIECELRFHFKAINRAIFSKSDVVAAAAHEAGQLGVSVYIFDNYIKEALDIYNQRHNVA